MSAESYLFEKMYLQCADIAILEEAVVEAKADLINLKKNYSVASKEIDAALEKIDIAERSRLKLKIESTKNG